MNRNDMELFIHIFITALIHSSVITIFQNKMLYESTTFYLVYMHYVTTPCIIYITSLRVLYAEYVWCSYMNMHEMVI